ncbi:hypothetical protein BdWA1_000767 [Babesia duncani]|uniref:Uncharacterized protein n=1 Tax=Babesia duncani TaxID=323732 RepID=A0AAD9PN09_9APIC|nr:hypothetical protein BdWA1_000767 [Babesia duncani]
MGVQLLLTDGVSFQRDLKCGMPGFLLSQYCQSLNGLIPLNMVGPRKVQSFTHRKRRNTSQKRQDLTKFKSKNAKKPQRSKQGDVKKEKPTKISKNDMLDQFGIDMGTAGQEIYDWLYPKELPNLHRKVRKKLEMRKIQMQLRKNRVIESNLGESTDNKSQRTNINNNLHEHLLHNYANETLVRAYKRIAFHMKINPRILVREVGALTGRFGISILQPNDYETGREIRADILCLRRIKFKVYSLIGMKLLRYTLMFFTRYIRLGIPPEIRSRFISDLLTRDNLAVASCMSCNICDYRGDNPLDQTYPERISFESQGYPYSKEPLFDESKIPEGSRWSPSMLIDEKLFSLLTASSKAKLVYVAAALHPEYALQIVKNVAYAAGFNSERMLLTKFCLKSTFTSRGGKAFVSKIKEELIADKFLRRAAKLFSKTYVTSLANALDILKEAPPVMGLIKRHLDSGHRIMPVNRARMIYKRIRRNVDLPLEEMMLWDVLRDLISKRVLDTPLRVYKNTRMELFSSRTYLNPILPQELEKRGIDASKLYYGTGGLPMDMENMERNEKLRLAKAIARNIKQIWLETADNNVNNLEKTGLQILDAIAAAAGYRNLNNVLVLVTLLSKPQDKISRFTRQPGPEFEHSPRLELKDFRFK